MRRSRLLASAVLALLAVAGPARADTVVLVDGRQVQGRTREEGDELVVQQKFGEVRFPRAQVVRVVKEDDVYAQLERKQKELADGTADERYSLGVWCREKGLDGEARVAFTSVLRLDPDHAGARAALGYVREDGRWLTEDDRMRAQGLVKVGARWMTPAEKVKLEADLAEKREQAREAAKKAEEEKELARKKKAEAEREARAARIKAYEDELARARAQRRAADEEEGFGLQVYQGPASGPYGYLGPWGGSYWAGPVPSTNDILAYTGARRRHRYPTYARPFLGKVVTYGTYGGVPDAWDGGWGVGIDGWSGGSFSGSSSSSGWGIGVTLQGSWTSRSGRAQIRFRTGF